ncbi:MAG TPA: GldG family protein [Aggregatilineaceae bacterium]|nr:GldG family protein [Anaerolineae bacterium]HMM26984.1 GldG family protein [Aggregatilineaceae bacterium]
MSSRRLALASAASVAGSLALVAAAVIYLLTGEVSTAVFLCVLIGVGGLGLWMAWAPGEFRAWIGGRQTRYGTTSVFVTILFAGLVIAVTMLAGRANLTADLTGVQRYTLNRPTLDTIEQVAARGFRVRLVGFFSGRTLREREQADLLLRQYDARGGDTIQVQYVDPDERPEVARAYGYQAGQDGSIFLVLLGADGQPLPTASPRLIGPASERDITTALRTLVSAGRFKIYFTTGHGELDIRRTDDASISRLAVSLIDAGIAAEQLSLLDVLNTGIPEDASAVMIAGARARFTDEEVALLDDYLQRGGRLAIFTDPPLVDEGAALTNTFLEEGSPFSDYLWNEFGVRPRDALLIQSAPYYTNEFTPVISATLPHPLLALAQDQQVIMSWVRPFDLVAEPSERQRLYLREPLFASSSDSYGETALQELADTYRIEYNAGRDLSGPLVVGVTVRRAGESQLDASPRLVLIGDSDIVSNRFVQNLPGNVWFWTDLVDWLTGYVQAVSFTPVSDTSLLNLVVSDQQRSTIAVITMLVLPGFVLALGAAVWWYRRR